MSDVMMSLWAKTDKKNGSIHPLPYHLIDTANVCLELWQKSFSPFLRRRFCSWLEMDEEQSGRLIAFWAALHDIGKASPAFQQKYLQTVPALEMLGLVFPRNYQEAPHGLTSAWALEPLLTEHGMGRSDMKALCRVLAGHHGMFPTSNQLLQPSMKANLGGEALSSWQAVRKSLFDMLVDLLHPTSVVLPADQRDKNAFLLLFSGMVTTSDWVASMENCFPYVSGLLPEEYWVLSASRAREAIKCLGFSGWHADGSALNFTEVFGFPPNSVQEQLTHEVSDTELPAMLIVEAPTGCGKTEAALNIADQWLQRSGGRGFYIAMPTTATSNQMFHRVGEKYLKPRYPSDIINLQLAHASSLLSDDLEKMILQCIGEDTEAGISAMGWFLPKKRTLLAQFAVGTVDQALMSVLQTKHFFVRLFGLSGKVIIFDEVHAYDTYMSAIFCRLLEWLNAAGVSVILLSATLPEDTRAKFAQAYSTSPQTKTADHCPRYTLANCHQNIVRPLPNEDDRTVQLKWCGASPMDIALLLKEKLTDGGCAAVVCNTVRRAQEVFSAVRSAGVCQQEDIRLFHARFPYEERSRLEGKVVRLYGKDGSSRPYRSILVATQVIEQSLDLDFDLVISDLSPIDLLIQRAGRLHRHKRSNRPRPLALPQFVVTRPDMTDDDAPDFGGSRYVYEPYILLRTLAALTNRSEIRLPSQTSSLIEAVYGRDQDDVPLFASEMQAALKTMEKNRVDALREAQSRLVLPPDDSGVIKMDNMNLRDDEDPGIHQSLQALTRMGSRTVNLVCLHLLPDGTLNSRQDGSGVLIHRSVEPEHEKVKVLLKASISVQHHDVVNAFLKHEHPEEWQQIPALRYHFMAVFQNGVCKINGCSYLLKLDPTLGLLIEKEVQWK
jgi:CRISPR-associated endonuclease/helicase Cas3